MVAARTKEIQMGRKKKADAAQADATTTNEATNETPIEATVETQPETAVATEPPPETEPPKKPKAKKKAKAVSGVATLADLAAAYAEHMLDEGKSDGTVSSYKMELRTAMIELGEDTPIQDITPEKVAEYFTSKRVTKLRSGKNKAKPSIDKTRRVLRLALCWAAERGIVAKAPLPEEPVAAK
jgi:hypothetical protein